MVKVIKKTRPPTAWRNDLDCVLIREREIRARVAELAGDIQKRYAGKDLVIVALLNGTVLFLADLIRHLEMPLRLDFMGVSSYGSGTSSGKLVMTKELKLDVSCRHVLLVDDILDTGRTLRLVLNRLKGMNPKSLRTRDSFLALHLPHHAEEVNGRAHST